MKLRTLAAAVLMTTLGAGPVMAQMAVPPPPPHGYGDYDEHHGWHDQGWWYEHHPEWVNQHHPNWDKAGAWDEDHHHWHDRQWWMHNHPKWVHEHHPHWFS